MMVQQTVLLVEDSHTMRSILRAALEAAGYRVLEAGDGVAALALLETQRPDLIVLDLVLPDADGFELTTWMRAMPLGGGIPIVVLSGFSGRLDAARAAEKGYAGVLPKPVAPSRLVEMVRANLRAPPLDAAASGSGRHLLLVDDQAIQRKLDVLRFEEAGFRVTAVSSGEEARLRVREIAPDVIVTDVLMPEMDGFELCQALRQEPDLSHVPIVLVSSHYDEERDVALGHRVGATAFVMRGSSQHLVQAVLEAIAAGPGAPRVDVPTSRVGERDRRLIAQLNKRIARQARLEERSTQLASEMSLLGGIADALTRSADTDTALRDVFRATVEASGISAGALYLGEGEGPVALRHAVGFAHRSTVADFFGCASLLVEIMEGGVSVGIPSAAVAAEDADRILSASEMLSLQVVPLAFEGRSVGALVLGVLATDAERDGLVAFARAAGSQIVHSMALIRAFERTRSAEASLRQANAELEEKVADRTRALSEANAALEQTVRIRQDMVAIVSHDLRNPLSIITLSVGEMLRAVRSDRPVTERDIGRVTRAAGQMKQLITNLLDVASMEERAFTVEKRPVGVRRLLDDALEAHLPLAEAKSLRLEVVSEETDGAVAGDSERLLYVFSNLIGNAIKFTPGGGRIALGVTSKGGDGWKFSVVDTGAGIAQDHLPHIFNRYWQGKATGGHGVGLGLAIAKGIVEAHGGRIWAESVAGEGATFQFTLPVFTRQVAHAVQ